MGVMRGCAETWVTKYLTTTREWIKDIELPKWPAIIIRGPSVPKEVAARICVQTSHIPYATRDDDDEKHIVDTIRVAFGMTAEYDIKDTDRLAKDFGVMTDALAYFSTNCYDNRHSLSESSWITWDGRISFDSNVGKWPTSDDLFQEWVMIATRFPELKLTADVYPCESCQINETRAKRADFGSIRDEDIEEEDNNNYEGKENSKARPLYRVTVDGGHVTAQRRGEFTPSETISKHVQKPGSFVFPSVRKIPKLIAEVESWWIKTKTSAVATTGAPILVTTSAATIVI